MKKLIMRAFFLLVIFSVLSSSAYAAELTSVENSVLKDEFVIQSSYYISSCDALISAGASGLITVNCGIIGTGIMDTIGVKKMQIQKYQSGSWVTVQTWYDVYSYNTMSASIYANYIGTVGSQYRAVITFYAANATGSDSRIITTRSVTAIA
jgi:hypothetical protein